MAAEIEYVNYKDFVADLESTENPGVDDVTVVSNSSDGPRTIPANTSALTNIATDSDLTAAASFELQTATGKKKAPANLFAKQSALETMDGDVTGLDTVVNGQGKRIVHTQGEAIVITDDSNNFVALIDDDGVHAKSFFIRDEEHGEDSPLDITQSVEVVFPNNFVAVVGDTLQLFYRGVLKSPNPYVWALNMECDIGKNTPRFYEVTPIAGDAGDHQLKMIVRDNDGEIIGTSTTTLKVVAQPSSPPTSKKILCFGASNTLHGTWPVEAARRLTGSGGTPAGLGLSNIEFCGGMNNGAGVGWWGIGGWTWNNYITNSGRAIRFQVTGLGAAEYGAVYVNDGNEYRVIENNTTGGEGNILCSVGSGYTPDSSGQLTKISGSGDATITYTSWDEDAQNPLWDTVNNKMSFIPYANTYCGGQIDVVFTLLTWNDIRGYQTDWETIIGQVKTFADTLHAEFPSAKLVLLGLNYPSLDGGAGANYGASGRYYDWYGLQVTVLNESKAYQELANDPNYSSFVRFVCTSAQFDAENNTRSQMFPVNTRNSATEKRGTNALHPDTPGLMQIADVVYRTMCEILQ